MANMIARLGVVLGLDSAEFVKGINSASNKLNDLAQSAVKYGAVAAGALTAASIAAFKYVDAIEATAKANDLAIDSVVKLSNALSLAGGSSQDAGKLLASFSAFLDKASDGNLEAQKSLEKLGIGLKELGTLSSTELLDKTVKALAAIEDPITRNAMAMQILGKAAKGLDIRELSTQMMEGASIAESQAKAIEQVAEMFDMLDKASKSFMMTLATQLAPPLKATIDYFREMSGEVFSFGDAFKTVFQTVAVLAANVAFTVKTLVSDFAAFGKVIAALQTFNYSDIPKIYDEAIARAERDRQRLDQFERTVMGAGDGRRGLDDPRIVGRRPAATGRQVTPAKDPEREKAMREELARLERLKRLQEQLMIQQQAAAEKERIAMDEHSDRLQRNGIELQKAQKIQADSIELQKQILALEENRGRLLPEQVEYQRERLIIEQQYRQNLEAINDTLLEQEERQRRIAAETENYYSRLELAQQKLDQTLNKRRGSFEEGFFGRMQDFFRDMPTELERGQMAFDSVFGNMEAALNRFVQTGKLSFKDLARSIIQDLIRIQLRAQMIAIFRMMFPGLGGVTSTGLNSVGATGGYNALAPFADGGDPPVGRPALVGERGPEIFVPRTAGTIIPNHDLAKMGGTTNVTNNYINAIDVKSFEDRLLSSSNTIWAANQYAQKSIPTGRGRT